MNNPSNLSMYFTNIQYLQSIQILSKTFNNLSKETYFGGFFQFQQGTTIRNIYAAGLERLSDVITCFVPRLTPDQDQKQVRSRSHFTPLVLVLMTLCRPLPGPLLPVVIIFCDTSFKISAIIIYSTFLMLNTLNWKQDTASLMQSSNKECYHYFTFYFY